MKANRQVYSYRIIVRIIYVFVGTVALLAYCCRHLPRLPEKLTLSPRIRQALVHDIAEGNPDNPGQRFNLPEMIQEGKYTVVEFYSLFSPQCLDMEPKLEQLASARVDIAVRKFNIDRPEKRKIDWDSPLARQYDIKKVPEFKLFDQDKKLLAQGQQAASEVDRAIASASRCQ